MSFGYNPSSQITRMQRSNDLYAWTGSYDVNRAYSVNGLNQYTSAGATAFGYDANGNLTRSGSIAYQYDLLNHLTSVTDSSVGGTGYTGFEEGSLDQLQGLNLPNGTYLRFGYDGDNIIGEYLWTPGIGASMLRRYVYGPGTDEPLVWYEGAGLNDKRYLHTDERGSVAAVSDNAGSVLAVNRYDEYGIPASTNVGRFQYTGQAWLAEVGLYYYKARIYSPTLGRFLQTDPIGYEDQVNLYAYVGNDPVNKTDPSGTYGRGAGFTDKEWKRFDRVQQSAASAMERRADKLDAKADKLDAKGKSGGDGLRERATGLRAGAGFLRSDGSDGARANLVSAADWKAQGRDAGAAARAPIGGNQIYLNGGHAAWSSDGAAASTNFIVGHESLHSAGYRHAIGPNGYPSYRYGNDLQQRAYGSVTGTPAANRDPDHLMSEVYP